MTSRCCSAGAHTARNVGACAGSPVMLAIVPHLRVTAGVLDDLDDEACAIQVTPLCTGRCLVHRLTSLLDQTPIRADE
jgi:hypothetical protein